jgi:hypothetical protein
MRRRGAGTNDLILRVGAAGRSGVARHSMRQQAHRVHLRRKLDQLETFKAGMPVVADDDVVVHGNAERGGDINDGLFRHRHARTHERLRALAAKAA